MSMIDISKLSFSYDGSFDYIFENVSFRLDSDWRLGFCGRNGRGKTTFLNLLMGKFEYRGTISASVAFEYFPYEIKDTGKEVLHIFNEIVPDILTWEIEKELSKLAVSLNVLERPFDTLSGGERTKVLLAALFLRENHFLLIDEPTTHLDLHGREIVSRYLKSKKGFILVSHDRDFLDDCVNHILSINKTNIEVQAGNFSSWFHNKQLRDSFEIAENERLKKDISRLNAAAKKTAAWSEKAERTKIGFAPGGDVEKHVNRRAYVGEKSRKMMARSKAIVERRERAADEKSDLLKNIETADKLKIHPLEYHAARLIELQDASVSYGNKTVVKTSFVLNSQERIAIMGGNGSGKSSIIKAIVNESGLVLHGNIYIASRLKISYVPQDASFLEGNLSDYAKIREIDESLFKAILRKLDFSRIQFEKDMHSFSSGQKKKVLIAASLCEKAHVYIWDEPLNYIDILSRIQIEELIVEYKPTMLFVEHDRAFCRNTATKEIRL